MTDAHKAEMADLLVRFAEAEAAHREARYVAAKAAHAERAARSALDEWIEARKQDARIAVHEAENSGP